VYQRQPAALRVRKGYGHLPEALIIMENERDHA
jgi:hypothetical protein